MKNDQRRSEFVFGQGTVAIADGDEWDDQEHAEGYVDTCWSRGRYPEGQTANIMVAFDGGQGTEIPLLMRRLLIPNPANANQMIIHIHLDNL